MTTSQGLHLRVVVLPDASSQVRREGVMKGDNRVQIYEYACQVQGEGHRKQGLEIRKGW